MTSLLNPLIGFVSAHAFLGYLTVFLAALLEAVPVAGSLVPGSTIILALSALVPGGELKLHWVLLAAIAGAIIGDGCAFWAGHRRQREILNSGPLARYPRLIAESEALFSRWGAFAVFIARFVAPIRAFVPITAGALGMAAGRFFPSNIIAIVLWACAHVLPGVLAISALHSYAALSHHDRLARHVWIYAVCGGALLAGLALWALRRRHGDTATAGRAG